MARGATKHLQAVDWAINIDGSEAARLEHLGPPHLMEMDGDVHLSASAAASPSPTAKLTMDPFRGQYKAQTPRLLSGLHIDEAIKKQIKRKHNLQETQNVIKMW